MDAIFSPDLVVCFVYGAGVLADRAFHVLTDMEPTLDCTCWDKPRNCCACAFRVCTGSGSAWIRSIILQNFVAHPVKDVHYLRNRGGVLALYVVFIHYPSTNTWTLSCYGSVDLNYSDLGKNLPMLATNGPATAEYLKLLTLEPLRHLQFAGPEYYANWQKSGPWVSPQETADFLAQPFSTPAGSVTVYAPGTLEYYLGPCPTDQLLLAVNQEAIRAQPMIWLAQTVKIAGQILVQNPSTDGCCLDPNTSNDLYLPRYDMLQYDTSNAHLGFARAFDKNGVYYQRASPALVWMPGVWLYSSLFDILNAYKYLAPLSLIWALCIRDWFYRTCGVLLLAFIGAISIVNVSQPRIFAEIYPFTDILIGGFVVFAVLKIQGWANKRRENQASEV